MALMCPTHVPEDTASAAEKRLFDVIRRDLSDDWTALHSLGLALHPAKPWAEIDFVLVGPAGIFCIEVKGGRVSRRDGRWYFTDRYDRTTVKDEGPFAQVGSAAAALRKHLTGALPDLAGAAVGTGVTMPDIEFRLSGPDIDLNVLYDLRDSGRSFALYMKRLSAYWYERLAQQRGRPVVPLSRHDVAAVVEVLRGDFDLFPSLGTQISAANRELLRLTNEQHRLIQSLDENERMVVKGGAGTGKTFLAVEEARRRAARGERVLYCCYNKYLAQYVRATLHDCLSVDVHHLHGFMACRRCGCRPEA